MSSIGEFDTYRRQFLTSNTFISINPQLVILVQGEPQQWISMHPGTNLTIFGQLRHPTLLLDSLPSYISILLSIRLSLAHRLLFINHPPPSSQTLPPFPMPSNQLTFLTRIPSVTPLPQIHRHPHAFLLCHFTCQMMTFKPLGHQLSIAPRSVPPSSFHLRLLPSPCFLHHLSPTHPQTYHQMMTMILVILTMET